MGADRHGSEQVWLPPAGEERAEPVVSEPERSALAGLLDRAAAAGGDGEVPVAAAVLDASGDVLAEGVNRRVTGSDPTAHAEIVALRGAGAALGRWRLEGCTLVVTLEPCAMCAGAAIQARVDRIVFGAFDDRAGACGSVWDLPRDRLALHRPAVVGGLFEAESAALLRAFFASRREHP